MLHTPERERVRKRERARERGAEGGQECEGNTADKSG